MLRRIALVMTAAALLATGCSGDDEGDKKPSGPLPAADELVSDAAQSASEITSTHFLVKVDGTVPGMQVTSIDGDLTTEGDAVAAQGTANLTLGVEAKFVLVDGKMYFDPGSGTYQEMSEQEAAAIYDFGAVLDPERGVAHLIESLSGAKTVAAEDVNGTATYKVEGTAAKDAIAGLVPQAEGDVEVSLWVTADGHDPVKASAKFPGEKPGTLSVTLSKVNEPVTVEPPA